MAVEPSENVARTPPPDDAVALWRQLFITLANKQPSPPFNRGGPGSDGSAVRLWEERYAPHLDALRAAIADRLARNAPLDEPLQP